MMRVFTRKTQGITARGQHCWARMWVALVALAPWGCEQGQQGDFEETSSSDSTMASSSSTSSSSQSTDSTAGELTDVESMYSLFTIPTFELTLPSASIEALNTDPKVYVTGDFRYGDVSLPNVGVRLKGNLSLTTLAEKPSFKLKFDEYVQSSRFLGLEKLTLHAMRQDSSMVREYLGYLVFRTLGLPAPRAGYAHVVINGESYGLYLNLETPDEHFLRHVFGDNQGNLYEGENGDDFDRSPDGWEQDEGDDLSRDDLRALRMAVTADNMQAFYGADAPLAMPEILDFLAGEAFTAHFDGYWTSHNFFAYHNLTQAKWYLLPWSLDQVFLNKSNPFAGGGYLKEKCLADERCKIEFIKRAQAAALKLTTLDLPTRLDEVVAFIDAAAHADSRKKATNEGMEGQQRSVRRWLGDRLESFSSKMSCLVDDADPDVDGDGHGACVTDCNDNDPMVHPGIAEACNGVDDDCNGNIDDDPSCPCPQLEVEGSTFYFCNHSLDWTDSLDFCREQDHELAYFDTITQNDAVSKHAETISGGRWAIGLNDRETENTYVWSNEAAPAFLRWAKDEPAHKLDWFDCVFFTSKGDGTWQELNCVQSAPFICR